MDIRNTNSTYCDCMLMAPSALYFTATDFESEDLGLHLKLLSLLENPAVIVAAAAAGDVVTLRDFLEKHPKEVHNNWSSGSSSFIIVLVLFSQVNSKAAGKAAIHCAAVAGNVPVIKVLLEFKASLEVEVRRWLLVNYAVYDLIVTLNKLGICGSMLL